MTFLLQFCTFQDMKPIIFIIFDGLGDRPIKELNWLTPLEAARKPSMDYLAKIGITGLLHTIQRGVRPGSDVAHLSIFGYDPSRHYRGRGPFEAAGYGIQLQTGDVAFRGNLATVNKNGIVIDRRAGRIESSLPFARIIDGMEVEGVKIIAKAGLNHRIALVLRGSRLSDAISDVDPHLVNKPVLKSKPTNNSKEARFTSEIVNVLVEKSNILFKNLPINKERKKTGKPVANYLLLRGAGKLLPFKNFRDIYGLRSACIAGAGLYKGIASILGMNLIPVPGTTGKYDTNVQAKIDKALELIKMYDFIFVHIKAPDSLAEDGDYIGKKNFLEKADKALKKLVAQVEKKAAIVSITGDHTTSSELKIHTADEVPILVAGFGVRTDEVSRFGERPCQSGGLGHMEGRNLIDFLINLRGESKLYGN